jgi:hypothetical protein
MAVLSSQKMKRFPCVGIFTQPGNVSIYTEQLTGRLTDFAAPAMLGVDVAEMCK